MASRAPSNVLNLLTRLKECHAGKPEAVSTSLTLKEEPRADLDRYDRLREEIDTEVVPPAALGALVIGIAAILVPGGGHVG